MIKKWHEVTLWHAEERGKMGSEFAQCCSSSLSSQGCLWPPRCPSKCSVENLHSHTPLQRKHSPPTHTHTHAYRRMCHEGPPAVAVTDMGNAQNTSIFKIWHAHSLSYTYTPKINMVGLFTLFTLHDFILPVCCRSQANNYNEITPDSSNKSKTVIH